MCVLYHRYLQFELVEAIIVSVYHDMNPNSKKKEDELANIYHNQSWLPGSVPNQKEWQFLIKAQFESASTSFHAQPLFTHQKNEFAFRNCSERSKVRWWNGHLARLRQVFSRAQDFTANKCLHTEITAPGRLTC